MSNEAPHLLVVDDNRMERLKLTRALQGGGYTVTAADSGEQALEKLRSESFDLMLLDIEMPGMNGYQVLESMRDDDELPNIPVIMVSGYDDEESAKKCKDLGARDLLPKTFDIDTLTSQVQSCLGKDDS